LASPKRVLSLLAAAALVLPEEAASCLPPPHAIKAALNAAMAITVWARGMGGIV
jgi:hypothetical protein